MSVDVVLDHNSKARAFQGFFEFLLLLEVYSGKTLER